MKKRGRKSRAEKEKIIDLFIESINYAYAHHNNFINIVSINNQLEKFLNWGYAIGRPIMFKIDKLKEWRKETDKVFKECQEKIKQLRTKA